MDSFALINGKVYVEKGVFAEAVYAEDGVVKQVGTSEEILARSGWDSEIIDCGGKTVIPGLNDSHLHLLEVGIALMQARISGAASIDELVERCRDYIKNNPELCEKALYSAGWNQDLFEGEKRLPNRHDLDRISTDIPVVLARVCGHVVSVNTKALELSGIDASTEAVGGTIEREASSYPNGILTESCISLLSPVIPKITEKEMEKAFKLAQNHALSVGLTSVQSNDVGMKGMVMDDTFALLRKLYAEGTGKLRYRHQVCCRNTEELEHYIDGELKNGVYNEPDRLALGPLKIFKDGSLGGRTALLRKDYADDAGNRGVEAMGDEKMYELCRVAADAGMQIVAHAIGDGAIEAVLDCYERLDSTGSNPLRNGIVHCQITDRPLLERIAEDKVLIMYQPVFLDYDMQIVEARCGRELASTSYAFATAEKLGIPVSYGTDAPVEDCNPMRNIYHAVTRRDGTGKPCFGFFPAECVELEDALDAYTVGSAYNEFKESKKGRIKPGFLADMVVLDTDIFRCDRGAIYGVVPEMTVIGGEVVYRRK